MPPRVSTGDLDADIHPCRSPNFKSRLLPCAPRDNRSLTRPRSPQTTAKCVASKYPQNSCEQDRASVECRTARCGRNQSPDGRTTTGRMWRGPRWNWTGSDRARSRAGTKHGGGRAATIRLVSGGANWPTDRRTDRETIGQRRRSPANISSRSFSPPESAAELKGSV